MNNEKNIDDQNQHMNENALKTLAIYTLNFLRQKLSLQQKDIDEDMGKITFNFLKSLKKQKIAGKYILDPAQIKSKQIPSLTMTDYAIYKKYQVVPVFIKNNENENIVGSKDDDKFIIVCIIPAIDADIHEENIEKIKKLFSDSKLNLKNNKKIKIGNIKKLPFFKIEFDKVSDFLNMFKTGAFSKVNEFKNFSLRTKSNSENEKPGEIKNENINSNEFYLLKNLIKEIVLINKV